jgi:hypothetical protein
MPERHFLAATAIAAVKCGLSFTIRRRRISVMPRFCKATSMVPCCRGAEHPASRRGRIRIIAIPTVEEVVVAVSIEPRRCGRARKHGRGPEYQESKFPCHDRGSSALTIGRNNRSERRVFQTAHPPNAGLRFDVRANLARISERVIRRVADVRVGAKLRRTPCEHMFSASPSNSDIHCGGRQVADGPKTDNRLIMTAEQGSQTEREPRVAGKQWPIGVRRESPPVEAPKQPRPDQPQMRTRRTRQA